ncbi:hypothetical protein HOD29_05085 [archaeon]|jgi:hypothetical protein|nr:hypothetical protein [archaeon]
MEQEKELAEVSRKSWHFRLNNWVLGKRAPDPATMKNLCPYAWISGAVCILAILNTR